MKFLNNNRWSLLLLLAMTFLSFYFYDSLPEMIATKVNLQGDVIKRSSKDFAISVMPITFLIVIAILNIMVKASPKNFNMPQSKGALDKILFGTGLLFFGLHLALIQDPEGGPLFTQLISFAMAGFLVVVGNVMGKTERNFFAGIRIPWTLASDANWRATHRLAGKLMVSFGVLLLVVSFFYSQVWLATACLMIPLFLPIAYSYWFYVTQEKALENQQA